MKRAARAIGNAAYSAVCWVGMLAIVAASCLPFIVLMLVLSAAFIWATNFFGAALPDDPASVAIGALVIMVLRVVMVLRVAFRISS